MTKAIALYVVSALAFAAGSVLSSELLVLTESSYGAVQFGVSLASIEEALGQSSSPLQRDSGCDFVTFKAYPGMKFMVEEGVVTRGDATDSTIPNGLDITVGSAFDEVQRRYPAATIERHAYDPEGHYIIFRSPDGKRAIVLEENEGKVTEVRAGLVPSVEYIEGCL